MRFRDERALHAAEAPDRIAWHLSREIERALHDVGEADRARVGIEVARALLDRSPEWSGTSGPAVAPDAGAFTGQAEVARLGDDRGPRDLPVVDV